MLKTSMVSKSLLHSAVRNNASWCSLVADSHRVSNEWQDDVWYTSGKMPPFYPNLVTLRESINNKQMMEHVESLPEHCGVKDSFADLDLHIHGFRIGFEAQWYGLPGKIRSKFEIESVHAVSSVEALESWVSAWGGSPDGEAIFRKELLQRNVRFLFRQKDGKIDAGLITNTGSNVTGISNTFGPPDGIEQCIYAAYASGNRQPLVGYGAQTELTALMHLGFLDLGKLRVWLR